jgi:hypothetical protein
VNALLAAASMPEFEGMTLRDLGDCCLRREPHPDRRIPRKCTSNWCPTDGPRKVGSIGEAIVLAKPNYLATITDLDPEWPSIRAVLGKTRKHLRDLGPIEMAWHAEPNRTSRAAHAHLWLVGPSLTPLEFGAIASASGGGVESDLRPVTSLSRRGLSYGMKLIGSSLDAPIASALRDHETYRALNGGSRLVHATRGFWTDRRGSRTTLTHATRDARREAFLRSAT